MVNQYDSQYSYIQAPDKALYSIENAGHLTDIDNPNEFNQALEGICQRL